MKYIAPALMEVSEQTGAPLDRLGISVWCVYRPRKRWRERWSGEGGDEPDRYLWRIERFRTSFPTPLDVAWAEGRGAIGECLRKNDIVFHDYRALIREFEDRVAISNAVWKKLCAKGQDRGFDQREYLDSIRRYEQVLAQPVVDANGRIVGCISLDLTPASPGNDSESINIDDSAVRARLHKLAEELSATVEKQSVRA